MNISYLKNKTDYYEVYLINEKSLNAEITKNETDFAVEGETQGLSITVVKDKKLGFAFTNDTKNFKKIADKAISMARANNKDNNFKGFVKPQKIRKIKNYSGLTNYSLKDFAKFKTKFMKGVKSVNKNILLSNGYYSNSLEKIRIINSEGLDLQQTSALNSFTYGFILKNKGELLSVWGSKEDVKPIDPSFSKEEAKRVIALTGKKTVNTMNCPVILHPDALSSLISKTLMFNINAENTQQKKSIFLGKLNKKVASKELTLIDDAITKGLTATSSFDYEGTPSQTNTIIDKGVLKTFLYNNYTALKEKKKSTGNAMRTAVTLPTVCANNTIIKPGKEKNLLEGIKKGVYVRDVLGVHTMNALTGDFSLGVLEGFYVEKGKIKYPLKNAMIAGNFYKMLNQITGIGDKTIQVSGASYLPEIKFADIKLIGKN